MSEEGKKEEYVFYVDAKRYETPHHNRTGAEIKQQAGVTADYQLYLEEEGDQPDKAHNIGWRHGRSKKPRQTFLCRPTRDFRIAMTPFDEQLAQLGLYSPGARAEKPPNGAYVIEVPGYALPPVEHGDRDDHLQAPPAIWERSQIVSGWKRIVSNRSMNGATPHASNDSNPLRVAPTRDLVFVALGKVGPQSRHACELCACHMQQTFGSRAMIELSFASKDFDQLRTDLTSSNHERCAVLFAEQVARSNGNPALPVNEISYPQQSEYTKSAIDEAELSPAVVAAAVKRPRPPNARSSSLTVIPVACRRAFRQPTRKARLAYLSSCNFAIQT